LVKILVPGGTGFVGWYVVRKAAEGGHEVVSLSRGIQESAHAYPIENIRIDLVLPEDLTTVLAGVDVVVHAAGILRETAGQTFERAHVGATGNLIDACKSAGVGKIIYMSALGVRANAQTPYLRTKHEAERLVEGSGLRYTIFRPSLVFGAGDRLITHLLQIVKYSPVLPVVTDGDIRLQPIWVGDVATAVVRALDDPATDGRAFELGGPTTMTFQDLVDAVKRVSGRSAVSVRLPKFLAEPFVRLGERVFAEPRLTEDQLALLTAGETCDPAPAATAFGLRMRPLPDVLPEYSIESE
jgi:NADH dehydrogenase